MKGSVLVVDDEPIVLKTCERVLGPEGFLVSATASPIEALSLIKREPFDLLITDIRMPEMDGIAFIKEARKAAPDINVVVITGFPSQESLKEALALRIVDYIPKPFSGALLLEVTEKAVQIRRKGAAPVEEGDFTEDAAGKLDDVIKRFKNKPGSLIPVLQEAQELVGYLPPVVQRHIAKGLNLSVSEIHGVVSFYAFFTMKPKGRHNVRVCLGTACYVKRAEEIVEKLKGVLGIGMGEVTPDRSFSLESVRCLGACGLAPVVVVDKDTYGGINPVTADEILNNYRS
jgi:NADH-quinone oxidoreductase subunit E/NADP-reducing hydrogenase subunit HndA